MQGRSQRRRVRKWDWVWMFARRDAEAVLRDAHDAHAYAACAAPLALGETVESSMCERRARARASRRSGRGAARIERDCDGVDRDQDDARAPISSSPATRRTRCHQSCCHLFVSNVPFCVSLRAW